MTIEEMHQQIEQETFNVDGLMPERIDEILNDMIYEFIRSVLPKKRNPYQEGIDDSVIAAKNLDTLKIHRKVIELVETNYDIETYRIPDNCLYPLYFEAFSHYSITPKPANREHPQKMFTGRIVDFEYLGEIMTNAITKSSYNSPLAMLADTHLKVVIDESFIIKGLYLSYLRLPQKVSISLGQNCDLPESVHSIIVNRAIAYILENSESERLQTKTALNQLNT